MDEIKDLIGKTFSKVIDSDNALVFTCTDGSVYKFDHNQDCCEHVYIEDICGNLSDLEGVPLTVAEEISYEETESEKKHANEYGDSCHSWTFYRFAGKATVTVRWFGSSNGYYSTGVDFVKVKEADHPEFIYNDGAKYKLES